MKTQPAIHCARVVSRDELAPDIISVWLRVPAIARVVRPGQFIQVKVNYDNEPFLRRPFSVAQQQRDRIRIVFREVGRGTAALAQTRPGDEWSLLGSLGKPAPLVRNRDVIIVGGGIGSAPLLFLAERICRENRVHVLLGARKRRELILRTEFRRLGVKLSLSTDDGSLGAKGIVTDALADALRQTRCAQRQSGLSRHPARRHALNVGRQASFCPVVFACGPRPMLRKVKELAREFESYAFWEERMGCGTGICYGCAVKSAGSDRYIRFCQEGPVLRMSDIEL